MAKSKKCYKTFSNYILVPAEVYLNFYIILIVFLCTYRSQVAYMGLITQLSFGRVGALVSPQTKLRHEE